MKLDKLIENCACCSKNPFETFENRGDTEVLAICSDSRKVEKDGLFIAVKGLVSDGHDYIESAFEKGAVAVICETNPAGFKNVVLVQDSRLAAACIAANFYDHPSRDMTLIGITGTNGKTTTSYLCESILTAAGINTGVIGTVEVRYGQKSFDTPVTTPDAIDLQRTLFEMKNAGVTHVVMEVSSHGLDLHRVDFCDFNAGIFTNLTQDHLDYHSNMIEYFNCKKKFFTDFLSERPSIINIDDAYGQRLVQTIPGPFLTVSTKKGADLFARDISDTINGLGATLCSGSSEFRIKSTLTGIFNLENIICAVQAAHALGIDSDAIIKGIENCKNIPGRLEKIKNKIDRYLFVDYAHTPDALESILKTLRNRAPHKLITVFGCGGDRDRTKRPLMGQMACQYSDIAIVTSDNPRSEDPAGIINDIIDGLDNYTALNNAQIKSNSAQKGYMIEADRKKAIETAVCISREQDIIVVAGKGHENYQITNSGTIHFDDREELKKAADELAARLQPIPWRTRDIRAALNREQKSKMDSESRIYSGISTDSRTIGKNEIFLALTGDTFDGHSFIDSAIEKGVTAFIVSNNFWDQLPQKQINAFNEKQLSFFACEDTLVALGELARFQRIRSNVKVLAITGSSGKTTTRKICENILKQQYRTHATSGNLNNEIGVPLTLLKLSNAHEWAVIEMGMNHPGEISRLTRMALPDIAMVLNTADVHLEGLGSVENVALAKAEIYKGVKSGGAAILPGFDKRFDILKSQALKNRNISAHLVFGDSPLSMISARDIQLNDAGISFKSEIEETLVDFEIPSPGLFMANNCLAAILAAHRAGITIVNIQNGLKAYTPVSGRLNIYPLNDRLTIMDDTYNANPASVARALETLSSIGKEKYCIAVLGDMLELGEKSSDLHRTTGIKAARSGIAKLFIFGDQVSHLADGAIEAGFDAKHIFHGDKDTIARMVLDHSREDTLVLIKGSRGMAMEHVIVKIKEMIVNI